MRILWVTAQFPCLHSGAQVRQFNLLKYLSQTNFVTVLSLLRENEEQEIPKLRDLGIDVITVPMPQKRSLGKWHNRFHSWSQLILDPQPNFAHTFSTGELRNHLSELVKDWKPDIVHLDELYVASLEEVVEGTPCVLTETNVESKVFERKSRYIKKYTHRLSAWIEMRKLSTWERKMLHRVQACVAVSNEDAAALRLLAPNLPVTIVPNGVDTYRFKPPNNSQLERSGLLFFGNLDYQPNIDALIFFSREIFPLIQSSQPDITLTIIGPNAPASIRALGDIPGVSFIGFVEDLRPYLWRASVCVVPLRSGGGTRIKILESLAAGCPVVSTALGAEGLILQDGQDLLFADEPGDFARTVLDLLNNSELRHRLAIAGTRTVEKRYDWKVITPQLEQLFASISS